MTSALALDQAIVTLREYGRVQDVVDVSIAAEVATIEDEPAVRADGQQWRNPRPGDMTVTLTAHLRSRNTSPRT